jgi:hypothetical protein
MPIPTLVLYDREHCDATTLTHRLAILQQVRANLIKHGCTHAGIDNAIECVEDLLAEHLPPLPAERML